MRASWVLAASDALANLGDRWYRGASAALRIPALMIGGIIAAEIVSGGLRTVKDARGSYRQFADAARAADPCRSVA